MPNATAKAAANVPMACGEAEKSVAIWPTTTAGSVRNAWLSVNVEVSADRMTHKGQRFRATSSGLGVVSAAWPS